jgi:excisionase family DNA binding protein
MPPTQTSTPIVVGQSPTDLISIAEAARRIGMHRDSLYRLARTGHFPPAVQIGARWRVSVPRLERFLHGHDIERIRELEQQSEAAAE